MQGVGGKCERCGRAGENTSVKSGIVGGKCEKSMLSGYFFKIIGAKGDLRVKSADTLQQASSNSTGRTRILAILEEILGAEGGVDIHSAEAPK